MTTQEISAGDLERGDWLLFEGDRASFLSQAIMKLTDSDVSHAALYLGDGHVAEEISPGLVRTPIEKRLGRKSYVMRRRDPHPDLDRVIDTANEYLSAGEKYAFGSLVLVGLILIYRKLSGGVLFRRAVIRILKAASVEIFGLLERFAYQGKTPMVCSQFVYQCFAQPAADDPAYRLDLEAPMLEAAAAPELLIDELLRFPVPASRELELALDDVVDSDPEELARELLEAMEASEAAADEVRQGVDAELYAAARRFCELAAPLLTGADPQAAEMSGLEAMADHRSYFVAPADLKKVRNGWRVGIIPPQEDPAAR